VSGSVTFEPSDPAVVGLGSEQRAGDSSTIVSAAAAALPVDVGRVAAMPAGHDVVDAALELVTHHASRIVAGAGVDIAAEQAASRLQDALRGREVIAQAQGVVMARQWVSAEVAYAGLLRSSRQAHIPLRRQAIEITASTQRQVPRTGSEP